MWGWIRGRRPAEATRHPKSTAMDVAVLAAALEMAEAPLVIDVRTPGEFCQGHIPGALGLPLLEIGSRSHELPKDRDIVCVCRSGHRSAIATMRLRSLGFRALNLTGGMLSWRGPVTPGIAE